MNIVKLGKRGVIHRLFHAKQDKDTIAAWEAELNRILHVFNVRSITSSFTSLKIFFQTELAINTHVAVVTTQNLTSEIHRAVVGRQDGTDGRDLSVSVHCTQSIAERTLTVAKTQTRFAIGPVY